MEKDYLIDLNDFLSDLIERQDLIKKSSIAKMEWADDDLFHTINDDIMTYLLYLSTDSLYVDNLSSNEKEYLESVIRIFHNYDNDKKFQELCELPKELHLDIIVRTYNSWFKDSKEARNIKFPLSYQERIDTIPISLQQLRCYDQYFHKENKILIKVDFYNIYKAIGYNYLIETSNMTDKRLEKLNLFLKHIDDLTFAGVKLSDIINERI